LAVNDPSPSSNTVTSALPPTQVPVRLQGAALLLTRVHRARDKRNKRNI